MSRQWMWCGAVALAAAGAQPVEVTAQDSPLAGTWILDVERSQNPQDVIMAARSGGGGMMMRGGGGGGGRVMMRGAGGPGGSGIMAILQAGQQLRIELGEQVVTLHFDDAAPLTLPLTGAQSGLARWGQQVKASARLADGTLTIETIAENGTALTEVFSAADYREINAELHVRLPSPRGDGAAQPIVIKKLYTPAR